MKKLFFLPLIFLTLFVSCKKDPIIPEETVGLINPGGVRRGWIIKSLNGQDPAPALVARAAGNPEPYNNLFGPATAGVTNTFIFQTPRGNDTTVITTKSTFQVNSVMLCDTLTINKVKTGHLVFDAFITPSTQELATAFAFFKAQDIKDLILDLRYNGGGLVDVAIELASYIAGTSKFSTPYIISSYNDKKTSNNTTYYFKSILSPLNLNRIVVITTRATASASEEVINGLKPHLTVTTIGDTTNGKPTGMNVWYTTDKKYIFAPVTFELVNSLGQGGYYAGLAPVKCVTDDITRDFNDKGELCFKEAIYFLEKGTFSTKGSYTFNPSIQFSEKPSWMNNLYIIDKSISPVTTPTNAEQARDALYGLMTDWYFWYKNLPAVTLTDYKDPYELMDTLRYKKFDRWSIVQDYDEFMAWQNGTFVGHGIRIGVDAQGKARILTIYNKSPLYSNLKK